MIKGSIQQEELIIENTYASHTGVPKYTQQTLKEKVVSKTIIEGGFNTPLTSVNKSSRQSIKKHWP